MFKPVNFVTGWVVCCCVDPVGLFPVVLVPPICYSNIKSIKSSYIPDVEDTVVLLVVKSIKLPVPVDSSVVVITVVVTVVDVVELCVVTAVVDVVELCVVTAVVDVDELCVVTEVVDVVELCVVTAAVVVVDTVPPLPALMNTDGTK
jgi:hypothetical protein